MFRFVCLAAILTVTTTVAASADDQADLKALIDKAIKAQGGEAKLVKFKAETFKGKGKYYGIGEGIDYTGEWNLKVPDKIRAQINFSAGGQMFTVVRVFNGDKLWNQINDMTQEVVDKDEIAEAKEAAYVSQVTRLLPLQGAGFQFSPLGEVKIEGKPAVGVRVSHQGHRDVNLYFDKDKGLLVKVETVIKDLMAGGKELTQETLLSDYKEIEGMQRAMKVVINRDGAKFIDSEATELEPKETIDDSVFGKP